MKVPAMERAMHLPFRVSTTSNFMIGVTPAASGGGVPDRPLSIQAPPRLRVLADTLPTPSDRRKGPSKEGARRRAAFPSEAS